MPQLWVVAGPNGAGKSTLTSVLKSRGSRYDSTILGGDHWEKKPKNAWATITLHGQAKGTGLASITPSWGSHPQVRCQRPGL
jgi:ABC-type molybdenum transport system ATPase subunit/photorepair protein PhrA